MKHGPATTYLAVVTASTLTMACEQPFEGDPAAAIFADSLLFVCNQWNPAEPDVEWGLFDIILGRSSEDDAWDAPSAEHRDLVQAANGTIVHEFNLTVIRAVVKPFRVTRLGANHVRGVIDADHFTVRASIGIDATEEYPDTNWMKSIGVQLGRTREYRLDGRSIVSFSVTMPDSAIPLIRSRHAVRYIEPQSFACLGSG